MTTKKISEEKQNTKQIEKAYMFDTPVGIIDAKEYASYAGTPLAKKMLIAVLDIDERGYYVNPDIQEGMLKKAMLYFSTIVTEQKATKKKSINPNENLDTDKINALVDSFKLAIMNNKGCMQALENVHNAGDRVATIDIVLLKNGTIAISTDELSESTMGRKGHGKGWKRATVQVETNEAELLASLKRISKA